VFSDPALLPWLDRLREEVPRVDLIDAHTHIGANDPDGYRCTAPQLLEVLETALESFDPVGELAPSLSVVGCAQELAKVRPGPDPLGGGTARGVLLRGTAAAQCSAHLRRRQRVAALGQPDALGAGAGPDDDR